MKKVFALSLLVILTACKFSFLQPPSAETILDEALQATGSCRSALGVESAQDAASFSCSSSADAGYTVSMTRYPDQAAAQTQFETERGETPLTCFHGYDQYEILASGTGNIYIVNEQLSWQAGEWVIAITAGYDYRFFHYNSIDFSEAVYSSAVKHDLIPAGTCP